MSHFYGVLTLNKQERKYQFLSKGEQEKRIFEKINYADENWVIKFVGELQNKEEGLTILKNHGKKVQNNSDYLVALYSIVEKQISEFINKDAFLLLDNGRKVFIYNSQPLYCARKKDGEIFISSDVNSFKGNMFSIMKEHSTLLFYNNNLKVL